MLTISASARQSPSSMRRAAPRGSVGSSSAPGCPP